MLVESWDLGEIIKNHVYVREIYSSNHSEKCLLSSKELVDKLAKIYEYLGIKWVESQGIRVKIILPDNLYPAFRDKWNETTIRVIDDFSTVTMIDRFMGYLRKEVVFASSSWMGEFESYPGDEVVISPLLKLTKFMCLEGLTTLSY